MTDSNANVLENLRSRYPNLAPCLPALSEAADRLTITFRRGSKLLICGNGGSTADSEHIVGELMKGFKLKRPLPSEARQRLLEHLPDEGVYLAYHLQGALRRFRWWARTVFSLLSRTMSRRIWSYAQQVYGYGKAGDALLAISTSGNSTNIVRALQVARSLRVTTLGLSGRTGGRMKALCDVCICVPEDKPLAIQERHLPLYHPLCALLEERFFR